MPLSGSSGRLSAVDWGTRAGDCAGDVEAGLQLAGDLGPALADASHREIVDALAAIAAADLTIARVVEPHLDALIIRREAGLAPATGTWGVFAAEDPRRRLDAVPGSSGWTLNGTKAWCSLGDRLDHALVSAATPDGPRLFAVDLRGPAVRAHAADGWVAKGLPAVTSVPVDFGGTPAEPVGAVGWYLARPGFAWGAVRVAACWLGGMDALVGTLREQVSRRYADDAVRRYNLGAADVACWSARLAVRHAAGHIDTDCPNADPTERLAADVLAGRVRAVVAAAAETVLTHVGHALGPAPLAFDAVHAQRVADLQLYVRQHHAERDLSRLGGQVAGRAAAP